LGWPAIKNGKLSVLKLHSNNPSVLALQLPNDLRRRTLEAGTEVGWVFTYYYYYYYYYYLLIYLFGCFRDSCTRVLSDGTLK